MRERVRETWGGRKRERERVGDWGRDGEWGREKETVRMKEKNKPKA